MESKAFIFDRATVIDEQFIKKVREQNFPRAKSDTTPKEAGLTDKNCLEIFHSQMLSRHLDIMARRLKEKNQAFYTIGSSGHEGNAAIAAVFKVTDMAFLHYRSMAFLLQRGGCQDETAKTLIRDQLLSFTASKNDPISGGRHKVFGSLSLNIPPQTSTVASHLPKAVGAAFSIELAKELKLATRLRSDSVILCSFGDAAVNHATALTAFNASQWIHDHQWPMPIVFICEDNGIGISVPTPKNWVETQFKARKNLYYIVADGLNFCDVAKASRVAEEIARNKKIPTFLHMKTVRLLGHAGSDIETQYHTLAEIEEKEADDPLLHSARILIRESLKTNEEILNDYEKIREEVKKIAEEVIKEPKLTTAEDIMSAIIPPKKIKIAEVSSRLVSEYEDTKESKKEPFEIKSEPKNMAQCLNRVLAETLKIYQNTVIFGEDVGKKGGVYRVTAHLQDQFGKRRVFDTLLDEQTILGLAIGLAHNDFFPIPEIQFLAFLHNAEDQIRGEASTLSFFSKGQFTNPMIIRIPGLGYQKGFGGHFHNDNAIAFLREIPGLIIACPSNGENAVKLFRECCRLVVEEQRVVIFLEPIALYMTKDLYRTGDGAFLSHYPEEGEIIPFGQMSTYGNGNTLLILTYGNGCYLSRQAEKILKETYHIHIMISDLNWLVPLNEKAILEIAKNHSKILIVDEGRKRGSLSEEIVTLLTLNLENSPLIRRVTGKDSFIPLGAAAEFLLPSLDEIVSIVRQMVEVK